MSPTEIQPQNVDRITQAFPANVIGTLLPKWDDIPEDFRRETGDGKKWCDYVHNLFFKGGTLPAKVKGHVEHPEYIMGHISSCLRSFEPKHEHKTAGVAWLLSLWYKKPVPARETA